MKKIFSLCAALLVAFAASAAVINISPTSPKENDNLRQALASAADGDEIVMAEGTYVESPKNYIKFKTNSVIVRAAEGAEVIIKPHVPFTIEGGAKAKLVGLKIDASELCSVNSYEHIIYVTDATDANSLELEGCEVYNFGINSSAIYCSSSNKMASCVVNNCYFHNNTKSNIFLENADLGVLKITNSTFANMAQGATDSYWSGNIYVNKATAVNVLVDHCTFYNVVNMNTDYGAVKILPDVPAVVSNCIFAMPESYAGGRAVYNTAGSVDNCLTYNYTKDSGHEGIHSGPTRGNCLFLTDPKFVHAAKGDYGLFKDSPAINAGSDSKTLGDPRWWPVKVAMKGAWDEWAKQVVFEDAADGLTATAKMHLDKNMTPGYEFKMLNDGEWCVNEGFWFTHDGNKKADNVVPQVGDGNPMVLKAYKGDYTFTWTYATKSLEVTFPSADTKYYLHGSFNEWVDIEMTENAGILSATAALEANVNDYRFKIKKVDFLENVTWYGAQDEINMMTKDNCTNWDLDDMGGFDIYITSDKKGDYKFSFNPAENKLSVIYPSGTGINNVEAGEKAVKVIENGQLYIIKNGVKINALGTVVK